MSFYATLARYYDSEHHDKTDDLILYGEYAEDFGDPVLIVGAGTGRVVLHLAGQGLAVTGIEAEPNMLERALHKRDGLPMLASRLTFLHGDALTVPLEKTFKLAIIPYNTLMHFHDQADQLALFKRLRGWVEPGGRLLIDLPNAGEAFAAPDTESLTLERTFLDQESGHLVMQQSVSQLDRAEQLMNVTWLYDEIDADGAVRRTVIPVVIRYFFLAEITLLLAASGFEIEDVYGDFDRAPFGDGMPRMIVTAR
ncbi:MAG: class I SAM-dependent methyltransferase [bacterium]|nr:class I SAM-dependent methyltransferase [bacterium]